MPDKKIILIGRNSFLSQNFSVFLKKKKIRFFIISYNNFMKLSHKRLKNYETILNFSINKDFVQKKYALKNDLDLKIAKKIKDVNVRLVVFSTSKVYKSASNIKETSLKNPLTNYGKNKLKSESSLKKILSNYVILRISNIIGRKLRKNKRSVTNTFFDIVRLNLKKKKLWYRKKIFLKILSLLKIFV